MSELGQVLRLDARRAAPLVAVPALALVGMITAWRAMVPGMAGWDNAVVALTASVRWTGPLAAALAAWLAVREHRLGYLRDLTARSPATGPLVDLLLLTHAALLAYGMTAMAVIGETVLTQRPAPAHPLGLLAGALTLVLHVVVGYLVGRLLPHPSAVAVTGAVTGLWAGLRGPDESWTALLPPAAIDRLEPFNTLRAAVPADQLLWSTGLATALVAGYLWRLTRRWALLVTLVGALAATGLGTWRLAAQEGPAIAEQAGHHVCRQWPLTICVHPTLETALPALEAALTPLAARLGATPAAFTRVVQRPDSEPVGIRGGVAFVHLPALAPGFEDRVVRQIQAALADRRSCADPRHAPGLAYRAMVDLWLRGEEAPAAPSSSPKPATGNLERASVAASISAPSVGNLALAAQRFAGWNETRRRAWLAAHYEDYRSCTLSLRHFR